jgi:glycosyltransferase involved in cell wall biosynthesis
VKTVLVLAPNVSPYPGGAESYISDLMNGLVKCGWHVICVTENPPEDNQSDIEYLKVSVNVERITSPVTVTWREMQFSLLDDMTELESKGIDVIHTNSIEASVLGRIISDHLNVPLVATIHESAPQEKSFGRGRAKLVFERLNLEGLIAPSSFYYNRSLKYNVDPNKLFKVVHGIDIDKMKITATRVNNKEGNILKILFVGRVYPAKGLHILIEALGKLDSNIQFSLDIVGPFIDPPYKEKIERMISELNLKDRCTFVGSVLPESVKEFMLEADLMIVPSVEEPFGLSIVEANILRLPIIAAKVGGIVDIIEHNKTGLLFEPENVADLVGKIKYFIDSNEEIVHYTENAYDKTMSQFSSIRMAEETINVYQEVIRRMSE